MAEIESDLGLHCLTVYLVLYHMDSIMCYVFFAGYMYLYMYVVFIKVYNPYLILFLSEK